MRQFRVREWQLLFFGGIACLTFYTAGILTNLFSLPIFSVFWFFSIQSAHTIGTYGAGAIAVTLLLCIGFFVTKKMKTELLLSGSKQTVLKSVASIKMKYKATASFYKMEGSPNDETIDQVLTEQPAANNQYTLTCLNCKKEVNIPTFMLEHPQSVQRVIIRCPDCHGLIDQQPKAIIN